MAAWPSEADGVTQAVSPRLLGWHQYLQEEGTRLFPPAGVKGVIRLGEPSVHGLVQLPEWPYDVHIHLPPGPKLFAQPIGETGGVARVRLLQMNRLMNEPEHE